MARRPVHVYRDTYSLETHRQNHDVNSITDRVAEQLYCIVVNKHTHTQTSGATKLSQPGNSVPDQGCRTKEGAHLFTVTKFGVFVPWVPSGWQLHRPCLPLTFPKRSPTWRLPPRNWRSGLLLFLARNDVGERVWEILEGSCMQSFIFIFVGHWKHEED